jgi:hypothetical protein
LPPFLQGKTIVGGIEKMTEEEFNSRTRSGRLVAIACIAWWVATVGGIIWVINANA